MDTKLINQYVNETWDDSIVPSLIDYIKIPNKSPDFDPHWEEHGYMEQAVTLIYDWCAAHAPKNCEIEVVRLPGRTPLIFMEIAGSSDETVLLYGHLDKQPEMTGWDEGLSPWKPVLKGDKLYGRGGADDGYAAFASLTAINALQQQEIPHARCVVIIEACEESGSYDLPHYIDALKERIGEPSLVVCLDSGCGNYDQLWMTTSLRGNIVGELKVEVLSEGVHSGNASGIVPDSYRVLNQLLARVEDATTGKVTLAALQEEIPEQRVEQAKVCAEVLGDRVYSEFPFHPGAGPVEGGLHQLVLNRTWRAALSIIGADGLPAIADGGNVSRPVTAVKYSMRIAPTSDATSTAKALKQAWIDKPPYGAKVTVTCDDGALGWNAPPLAPWLEEACEHASQEIFGKQAVYMGEGGTIPFMGMLGDKFPKAQFMITGVLGPQSNAHGPNEFLHIPMGKKLTACVSLVLDKHYQHGKDVG